MFCFDFLSDRLRFKCLMFILNFGFLFPILLISFSQTFSIFNVLLALFDIFLTVVLLIAQQSGNGLRWLSPKWQIGADIHIALSLMLTITYIGLSIAIVLIARGFVKSQPKERADAPPKRWIQKMGLASLIVVAISASLLIVHVITTPLQEFAIYLSPSLSVIPFLLILPSVTLSAITYQRLEKSAASGWKDIPVI